MSYIIPKIIHQIWIGDKPRPSKFMDTWRDKNPDFEYICWNEEEILKRNLDLECKIQIELMEEMCGKADIIRLEILYKYGGIYIDADSICINQIDDYIMEKKAFIGYENETVRPNLVANGTMGFPQKHSLCRDAIDYVLNNPTDYKTTGKRAWLNTGPVLITTLLETNKYEDVHIFPSYMFIPLHYTGLEYKSHGKVYAFQEWGSSKDNYDIMNSIDLPSQFLQPPIDVGVSILISSYNTKSKYIQECLESIKQQIGYFNIELIWINDGSDKLHTSLLKRFLENFSKTTRFINVLYYENNENKGIGYTLNNGINACSYELIIKMDSDDIMVNNRIFKQIEFMNNNTNVMICGSQIQMFRDNINNIVSTTTHKSLTWEKYKETPSHWFLNHPTLCYRKKAVIDAGNYDKNRIRNTEDFELLLRILKKYGYVHNLDESLLYYRLHDTQVTHNGGKEGSAYWHKIRSKLIEEMIK